MKANSEIETRKHALSYYHQGKSITEICHLLNRSRVWFYKWLHRYQSNRPEWYKDVSKAPHNVANKTHEKIVALVIKIRREQEQKSRSRIGAKTIQKRINGLGYHSISERTISRIIKRNNTSVKREQNASKKQTKPVKQQPKQQSLF